MLKTIEKLLRAEGIELFAPLPLSSCIISKKYLLERCGIGDGTVIMIAIPYLSREYRERNISSYAVPRDYHMFFSNLSDGLLKNLRELYPKNKFGMFSDHSPIDERYAAAIAGLGVIGKNQMLITERYSSYVFIGELITDATLECKNVKNAPESCIGCGKCIEACPMTQKGIECLSAITQKKGELSDVEKRAILAYGSAWGCDICQEVCPYTQKALKSGSIYTNIPYFNEELTPVLTASLVENMSEDEFSARAYSWRKKETVVRNLKLLGYK